MTHEKKISNSQVVPQSFSLAEPVQEVAVLAGEVLEAVTRLQVVQEPTITAQTSQVSSSVPQLCHRYLNE